METRASTTYYGVEVSGWVAQEGRSDSWSVHYRYSEFRDFYTKLLPSPLFSDAPFPGRTRLTFANPLSFGKCGGVQLDARRCALALWLQRVIEHPNSEGAWKTQICEFLQGCPACQLIDNDASTRGVGLDGWLEGLGLQDFAGTMEGLGFEEMETVQALNDDQVLDLSHALSRMHIQESDVKSIVTAIKALRSREAEGEPAVSGQNSQARTPSTTNCMACFSGCAVF